MKIIFFLFAFSEVLSSIKSCNKTFDSNTNIVKKNNFEYRNLFEETIKAENPNVNNFKGLWEIYSISKGQDIAYDDKETFEQIGQKLIINNDSLSFSLFNNSFLIRKPDYKILKINSNDYVNLKTTSFFYGFRPCRDKIFNLNISDKYFFEIINYDEIAYYYYGKIYFFKKL